MIWSNHKHMNYWMNTIDYLNQLKRSSVLSCMNDKPVLDATSKKEVRLPERVKCSQKVDYNEDKIQNNNQETDQENDILNQIRKTWLFCIRTIACSPNCYH